MAQVARRFAVRPALFAVMLILGLSVRTEAQPLTRVEFDAVVAEAPTAKVVPPGAAWATLDRDRLQRMLAMPEFGTLRSPARARLVDQAAAWDLMPLTTPSEAMALWARMFPDQRVDLPADPLDRSIRPPVDFFRAEDSWAPDAVAMLALLKCLPPGAWRLRDQDPMLQAMEVGGWYAGGEGKDVGDCVLRQRIGNRGEPPPAGWPESQEAARRLAAMISRLLLARGCTGQGPDRCLPLLHALRSLAPSHPALPAILRKLEGELAPAQRIEIPSALRDRWGPDTPGRRWGSLTADEEKQVHALRRTAMSQAIFLSAKVPVLMDRPQAWPDGEIDRTLATLLDLTIVLKRGVWLMAGRGPFDLDNQPPPHARPWDALQRPVLPPAAESALARLGREQAAAAGCALTDIQLKGPPPVFWFGYGLRKLETEGTDCGALPAKWVADRYWRANGDAAALEPIAGLRAQLQRTDASPPARAARVALGGDCGTHAGKPDPWQLCDRAREDAEQLRRARLAGVWRGLIGTAEVVACLSADGRGAYFYASRGRRLTLQPDGEGWTERSGDATTGRWRLRADEGTAPAQQLDGHWDAGTGARRLTLHLERTADAPAAGDACASPEFAEAQRAALTAAAAARPARRSRAAASEGGEDYTPYQAGDLRVFAPAVDGLDLPGGWLRTGSDWFALTCAERDCRLVPAALRVTGKQLVVSPTASRPGQRVTTQARSHAGAEPVLLIRASREAPWLSAAKVPTWYDGRSEAQRPDTPGDLEALLRKGPRGEEVLLPVLRADGQVDLVLRIGAVRQVIGTLEPDPDDDGGGASPPTAHLYPGNWLHWAGDLDGDGRTDVVLTLSGDGVQRSLYLSTLAGEGEHVGLAGTFRVTKRELP